MAPPKSYVEMTGNELASKADAAIDYIIQECVNHADSIVRGLIECEGPSFHFPWNARKFKAFVEMPESDVLSLIESVAHGRPVKDHIIKIMKGMWGDGFCGWHERLRTTDLYILGKDRDTAYHLASVGRCAGDNTVYVNGRDWSELCWNAERGSG